MELSLSGRASGHRVWVSALLRDEHGRVLLYSPPPQGTDPQWYLPGGELPVGMSPDLGLTEVVSAQLGITVGSDQVIAMSYVRLALPEARVFHEPGLHLVFDVGRRRAAEVDSAIRADPVLAVEWRWVAAGDAARLLHLTGRRRLRHALAARTAITLLQQPPRHDGAVLASRLAQYITDEAASSMADFPPPTAPSRTGRGSGRPSTVHRADPPPIDPASDTVVIVASEQDGVPVGPPRGAGGDTVAPPVVAGLGGDAAHERARRRSGLAEFWNRACPE